jgi:hypothetical protein
MGRTSHSDAAIVARALYSRVTPEDIEQAIRKLESEGNTNVKVVFCPWFKKRYHD